MCIIGDTGED